MNRFKTFLKSNTGYIILFAFIFLSDILTKLSAFLLMDFETDYYLTENIILHTVLNNSESERILNLFLSEGENLLTYTFFTSSIAILISIILFTLNYFKVKKWIKFLTIISFYFILSLIADFIPLNSEIKISYHFSLWFSILSIIFMYASVLGASDLKINKYILIAIIAAGSGNLISHFYPPYYVIDFIYIPAAFPGIFNLADFYYFCFLSVFIILNSVILSFKIMKIIYKQLGNQFMKKTPEAVIFDMDGVLIDSEPLHYEAETSIFKIIGADFTEEERHSFIGTSIRSMYGDIIKRFNLKQTVEELINQDKKIRLEFFSAIQELKPIEGVENLLVLLKKEKIKTAIASSSSEEIINLIIEKLGFADYFDVIVSGDSVLHAKPEPDIFLKTVELLNTDTTKCIIIEDSKNGVIAAKKSGIKVIAYKNINSGIQDLSSADIIVNSINEINPGMISSLLKHKSSLSGKKSSIKILT